MKSESKPLSFCTPEEVGVPSAAIEKYISAIQAEKPAMHSLLIMRHNKLIFEGYWKPMDEHFRHRLYSCSKSFVSCAIGLLIERGQLSLADRAISFFPDKAPAQPHPWLAEMTIRDLLRMSTCYETGASYKPSDPDWEKTFFTDTISHKPGMVFSYCTTATTMLCMIIKRISGMEFTQLLRPVFDELGISDELYCIETPCGHEWGGSGVMATAREFLKFANLCMHYGEHEGRQLLPRDYMKEATSVQIDNSLYHSNLDEACGYGYQFWVMRHGFSFFGMGGQYAICLPEKDMVVVTTGYDELNNKGRSEIFRALWRELYPALAEEALAVNPCAHDSLTALGKSLELLRPDGSLTSPMAESISGQTYIMSDNRLGFKWVRFEFKDGEGIMHYENATGLHALPFGFGRQVACPFPESHYNGRRIGTPLGHGLDSLVSAAWKSPHELMIYCHVVDMHLAQLRIAVSFEENFVTLHTQKHAEFFMQEYNGFATGEYR